MKSNRWIAWKNDFLTIPQKRCGSDFVYVDNMSAASYLLDLENKPCFWGSCFVYSVLLLRQFVQVAGQLVVMCLYRYVNCLITRWSGNANQMINLVYDAARQASDQYPSNRKCLQSAVTKSYQHVSFKFLRLKDTVTKITENLDEIHCDNFGLLESTEIF